MRKSTYQISKNDLYDFARLLEKGYSISDSLRIVGNYEMIIEKLSQGEAIEQFLDLSNKDSFYHSLSFFIKISSLDKAIISSYEYDKMKLDMKNNWFKEIAYPIFVLVLSIFVFVFFEIYLYPQFISFLQINDTFLLHDILLIIMNLGFTIILIVTMLVLSLIYLSKKNHLIFKQLYLSFLGKQSLFKEIFSYDFALNFYILMQRGFSTKQVFDLLMNLKKNQLFIINIEMIIEKLKRGFDILDILKDHPYFDSKFIHFFKIGYYTQSLDTTIFDYCKYQEERFKKKLKRSTKIITLTSYIFISILIIAIYQLILLPLEMIQQF